MNADQKVQPFELPTRRPSWADEPTRPLEVVQAENALAPKPWNGPTSVLRTIIAHLRADDLTHSLRSHSGKRDAT